MDKDSFADSQICEEKVEEILRIDSFKGAHKVVRAIKHHDKSTPLVQSDFYPSIMERNDGVMPPKEKQINKTKIENFGTSFYLLSDNVIEIIKSVPALWNETKALACGKISSKYGKIGKPDYLGHLVLYLFNPTNNNLPRAFDYMEL